MRGERDGLAKTADSYAKEGRGYADALLELQAWSDQAEAELQRLTAVNTELAATVAELKDKELAPPATTAPRARGIGGARASCRGPARGGRAGDFALA